MLQLAHPDIAQPKLGALRPQVCHGSFAEPERAPSIEKRSLGRATVTQIPIKIFKYIESLSSLIIGLR